jgi:GMP synthase (glutamine-hydrolysing)
MRVHVIQHEAFEDLGAIKTWLDQKKIATQITLLSRGDAFPKTVDNFDFLIIMGGPQSPATLPTAECPYFDGPKEVEFIKRVIAANKKILGVCLGAQMIGAAYGAEAEHSPEREIGVFPIRLTAAAASDPFFSNCPAQFSVGHWHNDMPGLSPQAVVLAQSAGCPRQIIRFSEGVYGFQCHMEFNKAAVVGMLQEDSEELKEPRQYVQKPAAFLQQDFTEMNAILFKFLDFIAAKYEREAQPSFMSRTADFKPK